MIGRARPSETARHRTGHRAAGSGDLPDMSPGERAEFDVFESLVANGRPLGEAAFLAFADRKVGRSLHKGKPGPKPRPAGQ